MLAADSECESATKLQASQPENDAEKSAAANPSTPTLASGYPDGKVDPVLPKATAGDSQFDPSSSGGPDSSPKDGAQSEGFLGRLKKVAENDRVQQSYQFMKKKTTELAENERVQKSIGKVKELAEHERVQKSIEKVKEGAKVIQEKTSQGIEVAKEKTKSLREGAGAVWQEGRGSISRLRTKAGSMAWKGSARDTLDMAAMAEQWKDIRVQGAEEINVPPRTEHTSAYHVTRGSTLRWTFRVKEHDIGFGVRLRVQVWGGAVEEEVLPVERYDCQETISGSWMADENRTIILSFDNRYSKLRSKTIAYLVGTEPPPVFTEPIVVGKQESSVASEASEPTSARVVPMDSASTDSAPVVPTDSASRRALI